MPTSQRPRRAYAGPRSVRDLERRPSFLTQLMEEAANPRPPAPPKRALSRGRVAAIGAGAAAAGGGAYALHRRRSRVRKGDDMILVDPFSGGLIEVSKSYPIAVPVQSSTKVTPRTPSGPHVSHENRLRRFKNKPTNPRDSRVQQFHSGTMTEKELKGGGRSFGSRARRVKKNFEGHQPIVGGMAERGSRGTPLSELGRHNRVGHKLPV
jgi:hypothetical protein